MTYTNTINYRLRPVAVTQDSAITDRAVLASITSVYCAGIYYTYNSYLSPIWGYFGFPAYNPDKSETAVWLGIACAIAFSLALPTKITRYSQFVVWFLFYFIFVPTMVVLPMQGMEPDGDFKLVLAIAVSFAFILVIPAFKSSALTASASRQDNVLKARSIPRRKSVLASFDRVQTCLIAGFGVIFVTMLWVFGSRINLVNFADTDALYAHRADLSEVTSSVLGMNYLLSWFARVFSPFLIAAGLIDRRWSLVTLGVAGLVLVYSIMAAKYIPAALLLMAVFHYWCFAAQTISPIRIGLVLTGGLLASLALIVAFGSRPDGLLGVIMSQSLLRFYGNPGAQIGIYAQFFSIYEYTYYSHLAPVSLFYAYPFHEPLGKMIGWYWVNAYGYNANASFWATDGIAACGYTGVILIGPMVGATLSVADRFVPPDKLHLVCLSSIITLWMMVDASFFSVLLTGGAAFHIILARLYDQDRSMMPAIQRAR